MRFSTFHFGDRARFGAAIRLADGSAYAGGWSYPFARWSYPFNAGWSYPNQEWSYPVGPGWSYIWGVWGYPDGWGFPDGWIYLDGGTYPHWDGGWSYSHTGWSYAEGAWSYPLVKDWSYELYDDYSYPGGWSYVAGWSYDRTFAVEREHIRAGQVVLTSYLSAWWLNAVVRGADGTEAVAHGAGARVVPLSYGTLREHPEASGFRCFHLSHDLEPWVGQVVEGYIGCRRHILSVYAWADAGQEGGEIALEADWGTGDIAADDYFSANWNSTWDAHNDAYLRRMSPNGEIEETHSVPAGLGQYRFWVPVPPKAAGHSLRIRVRATAGEFFIDRVKLEPDSPLFVGRVTAAGDDWLECSGAGWATDEHANRAVFITGGPYASQTRRVASNTGDRLIMQAPWAYPVSAGETFEVVRLGADVRPTAYVDEGMLAGWLTEIRAENIAGGLLTLGGPTISQGTGGARARVLDEEGNVLVTIGDNTSADGYRGIDLAGGSGLRIAAGSGGKIEIGDDIVIAEDGYYAYNEDGARTVWLKSGGGFTFATGSEWKQRLEFDSERGLTFYDDANVPFASFNPQTATIYLGREWQPHIAITPDAVTVHGSLIVANTLPGEALEDGAVTADKISVTSLSAITASMGSMIIDDSLIIASGGYLKAGSGTKNVNLTGFQIDANEIVGQNNGVDQFYVSSADGKAYFGGGDMHLDEHGIVMGVSTPEANTFAHFVTSGEKALLLDASSTQKTNTNDIKLRKSASAIRGEKATTADGEYLGTLRFAGVNNAQEFNDAVILLGIQDGTAGDYVPGAFTIRTSDGYTTHAERLRISAEGIVTLWKQSQARAHLGTNQSIPSATDTLVALDTEDWDTHGEFSTGAYTFTARKEGFYLACAGATFDALVSDKAYSAQIIKYDEYGTITEERAYSIMHASNTTHLTVTVSDVFNLSPGESLKLVVWHNAGSSVTLTAGYHHTWLAVVKVI
ncbi:MAG: hypothetical protein QHJ81_14760 [Anaerolineae bacterium]|nr:hypothetical protein [Anaerolineae bacterium]